MNQLQIFQNFTEFHRLSDIAARAKDKERYLKEMEDYTPTEGYAKDGSLITAASEAKRKSQEDKVRAKEERKREVAEKRQKIQEEKERKKLERNTPKRDPNAPKKPTTSYFLFAIKRREEITKEEQDKPDSEKTSFLDLSKKIGVEWKEASDDVKQEYNDLAAKDKERYLKELKSYSPAEGYDEKGNLISAKKKKKSKGGDEEGEEEDGSDQEEGDGSKKRKRKRKKDPDAPKAPQTAYHAFRAERTDAIKAEDSSLSFGEVNKQVGAEWRALDDAAKEKYNKIAKKDKARYKQEMEEYNKKSDKGKKDADDNDDGASSEEGSGSESDDSSSSGSGSSDSSGSGSGSDSEEESSSDEESKPPKKKAKK